MEDPTETIRRQRIIEINAVSGSRAALEAIHGQVWDSSELGRDFDVIGFLAPLVVVIRKVDCREFQHNPRLYFNFSPHQA